MKSILDPSFHYTPSAQTDVRKTFARIRQALRIQEQPRARDVRDAGTNALASRLRPTTPAR